MLRAVEPRPGRRLEAALALLVWALGGELMPLAHVALHAALPGHDHGARVHDHGEGPHRHEGPGAAAAERDPASPEDAHGDGSFAHRDLAAAPSALALPAIAPARLGAPLSRREPARPAERSALRASARGPPVA